MRRSRGQWNARPRARPRGRGSRMERLQPLGAARRDAEASDAAVRALLRSRVNFSQYDDDGTAQFMLSPPEHSPVVAKLLGVARRDLALLEMERRDVLRSIYRNPLPHIPGPREDASVGEWALRQPSLTDESFGSSTITVFPETSSKSRVMLPEWPPRPAVDGGAYPSRSLPPLKDPSQDADVMSPGLRQHASRQAEALGEPRNAATVIRANAERQIRQLCERGFLTVRTRLVLEVEVDPGPEALRLGDRKGSKSQKVLKTFARALSRENRVDFSVVYI